LNINRDYGNIIAPSDGNAHRRPQNTRLDGKPRNQAADIRSGASGVVAYISGKTLYVANVGRSLAVLANRNGQARPMTTKHEPLSRDEWTQIRHSEGWVSNKGFVNDELDVSKSFGHYHVFPHINASPAIQIQELTEGDELIILANRGFWDFVDYQTAVDIARSERADPMSPLKSCGTWQLPTDRRHTPWSWSSPSRTCSKSR
jgi:adenylate cyclase